MKNIWIFLVCTQGVIAQSTEKYRFLNTDTRLVYAIERDSIDPAVFCSMSYNKLTKYRTFDSSVVAMFSAYKELKRINYYKHGHLELLFVKDNLPYTHIHTDSLLFGYLYKDLHELYATLFGYEEIKTVSIYWECERYIPHADVLLIVKQNITYLPNIANDRISVPKGVMRKQWYRPGTDYSRVFTDEELSNLTVALINQKVK